MDTHNHTFSNKVHPCKQSFHNLMEQNKAHKNSSRQLIFINSEVFTPCEATPPNLCPSIFKPDATSLKRNFAEPELESICWRSPWRCCPITQCMPTGNHAFCGERPALLFSDNIVKKAKASILLPKFGEKHTSTDRIQTI